jgi:hypothetical protein
VPRTSYLEASEYAREKMLVESPSTEVLKTWPKKQGKMRRKLRRQRCFAGKRVSGYNRVLGLQDSRNWSGWQAFARC